MKSNALDLSVIVGAHGMLKTTLLLEWIYTLIEERKDENITALVILQNEAKATKIIFGRYKQIDPKLVKRITIKYIASLTNLVDYLLVCHHAHPSFIAVDNIDSYLLTPKKVFYSKLRYLLELLVWNKPLLQPTNKIAITRLFATINEDQFMYEPMYQELSGITQNIYFMKNEKTHQGTEKIIIYQFMYKQFKYHEKHCFQHSTQCARCLDTIQEHYNNIQS